MEHLLTLGRGGGVVEVDDRAGRALDGLEGAADDVVAALGQHLHGDVVGDHILLDEGTQELVLGLAGGREADLDLLEADPDQHLEELQLLFQAHGHDQRLIAVAQVHAAPCRCLFNVIFFDPAVVTGRYGVIPRCVLGSVHHIRCPPGFFFPALVKNRSGSSLYNLSVSLAKPERLYKGASAQTKKGSRLSKDEIL